ncbi:MAG: methyltransferase [Actinobacteria bacterium]|nr:methyltransferase [Actinomycetota bacterium]
MGHTDAPATERVARELVPVLRAEPGAVQRVWYEAVERHGAEPTALQVREVVQERTLVVLPPVVIEDAPLPEGQYRVIVADPPWRYGNTATRGAAEDHYPTMSLDELAALEVETRSAPDAHLYLWVTNGFLREGFDLITAWGFIYKTCLTWVKPQMGMGNYFRSSTEHVLFGVRGSMPIQDRGLMNWFEASRGKHSAKPDSFYDLVEKASRGPYLEMFARRRRLGWHSWGNEA